MQQHSQELMLSEASPLPCLQCRGKWILGMPVLDSPDSVCSFDSCFGHDPGLCSHCNAMTPLYVSASYMTVWDTLRHGGGENRNPFYGKVLPLYNQVAITTKAFSGCGGKYFCKSSFATMENSELTMRENRIFLAGNRVVFALSSLEKSTLPR